MAAHLFESDPEMLAWTLIRAASTNDAILSVASKYAADRAAGIKAIEAAMADEGFMRQAAELLWDCGENALAFKRIYAASDDYDAKCTAAGLQIDPETAQVTCWYGNYFDTYRMKPYLPGQLMGGSERLLFARAPGSDLWIFFADLPEATRKELRRKIDAGEVTDYRIKNAGDDVNVGDGPVMAEDPPF
jgi:hypothetical protein